ncbi:MAG: hypothetical protein HYS27_22890 [Deltaproteobacteria bacterium]|nr:hypothetical protein [Deltaproteobacteria bacterium]
MAPKATVISTVPDPFEAYNELVRRARRSWLTALLSAFTTLLAMALAFLSFTRPLPVVVTSDDPSEPRRIVAAGDVGTREIDAKRFFQRTALKLHGWSSANVVDELTAASLLMTTPWRKRFVTEMNADVPVPAQVDASGKAPLLRTYVLARIRNELELDWDSVSCAKTDGVWHCKGSATMRIQPLAGSPIDDPKLKKVLDIRASFIEVAVTQTTLDGLLVDFWDASERSEK